MKQKLRIYLTVALLVFAAAAASSAAYSQAGGVAQENLDAGALIIAMDNVHQGNAGGTTFNLRAYGLANALLQNDVPVKWVIKSGKAKDDTDVTVNVTRIAGSAGVAGPADVAFSGGPFVIEAVRDTPAVRNLIAAFSGAGTPITVYKTNAAMTIDVRYTLNHKPNVAIGPDGGLFGGGIMQNLLDTAGIPNYSIGADDTVNGDSCSTIAILPHSTNTNYLQFYRNFVLTGGNLLLQCESIRTYENLIFGRYQSTSGYLTYGTNAGAPDGPAVATPLVYPNGSLPFNQFIGELANQDGAVTEFAYAAGGGPANGNTVSVRNSGSDSDKLVAAVSQVPNHWSVGGNVFSLGGHDYNRTETGASEIAKINGQRMALNALFVPPFRGLCGKVWNFDFDSDGIGNMAMYDPAAGRWTIRPVVGQQTEVQLGMTGDMPVPADYDGDRTTDLAVFRPSSGSWHVLMSSTGSTVVVNWGTAGDLPVPADHDGDAKADFVVFRPSEGNFYFVYSGSNTLGVTQFGQTGDKPVIGDFDGNGTHDIAVYRPSDNNWYIRQPSGWYTIQTWGQAGDIPVPGDYDYDGKTDIAVFRPSTGQWYLKMSTSGFNVLSWGEANDIPVPADYQGDGKVDLAIYRPSTNTWWTVNSVLGVMNPPVSFGQPGEVPVPSAFIY